MDRTVPTPQTALPRAVSPHRLATLIATLAMVAILAGMVAGLRQIGIDGPPLTDNPTALLFATG